MLLPFVPEMFTCAACGERWPADVLCGGTFETAAQAWCVQCCGCQVHQGDHDPGGTVVWPWHGLHRT